MAKGKKVKKAKRPARKEPASVIVSADVTASSKSSARAIGQSTVTAIGTTARNKPGPDPVLTAEQIKQGDAFLLANPDLKQKDVFDRLRKLLNTRLKNTTLWEAFFSKEAKRRRQQFRS
jgi:hypothetical protein